MHRIKYLYVLFNFFVVVVALYACFVVSIFLLLLALIALAFSAIVILSMHFLSVFLVIVVGGVFFRDFLLFRLGGFSNEYRNNYIYCSICALNASKQFPMCIVGD